MFSNFRSMILPTEVWTNSRIILESGQEEGDNIKQAVIDVTTENDQLRQTIQEMEKCASDSQNHLSQVILSFNSLY